MNDDKPTPEEIQKLANMDTKTRMQAMQYVTAAMQISKKLYYNWVYPEIKDEFLPMFIDQGSKTASNVRIPTSRLDEIISYFNSKLRDHVNRKKKQKEY